MQSRTLQSQPMEAVLAASLREAVAARKRGESLVRGLRGPYYSLGLRFMSRIRRAVAAPLQISQEAVR